MTDQQGHQTRRTVLRRMAVAGLGAMAARGIYDILDGAGTVERAEAAATVRRMQEQYLVRNVEVILDNNVTLAIPPLHNDVFTARWPRRPLRTWRPSRRRRPGWRRHCRPSRRPTATTRPA